MPPALVDAHAAFIFLAPGLFSLAAALAVYRLGKQGDRGQDFHSSLLGASLIFKRGGA